MAIAQETALIPAWVGGALLPVDKIEVHRRGLRHKAVSVFVTDGHDILIQRRALSKYHTPGLWANTCCTHPHWNEPPLECAIRRLAEELGISGVTPVLSGQVEYRADVGGGMTEHELVDVFLTHADQSLPLAPDPAEVLETRWVSVDRLQAQIARTPGLFTPWLRIYLSDHREAIFGQGLCR